MKKVVRVLSLAICVLLLASLFVACQPSEDNKEYVEAGATKIRIYAREFEQWARDHLKKLVNEFNKDLTDGIQVEVNFYTQDTYADALTVARENGKSSSSAIRNNLSRVSFEINAVMLTRSCFTFALSVIVDTS